MPTLKIVSRDTPPLACKDLIDKRLINEAHCCLLCHDLVDAGEVGTMRAVVIPLPAGNLEAEICCSQALTINAHQIIGVAADISLEGLTA